MAATPRSCPWGGFFAGRYHNFVILGRSNPACDDSAEVIRVIKYDKAWNRLGQAGVFGANTAVPFGGGSLRCFETNSGGLLVHTCHIMYSGHQANMTFTLLEDRMEIRLINYAVGTWYDPNGYVSHSFNQFVIGDHAGGVLTFDHGDSYPRTAYLKRLGQNVGIFTCALFPGNAGDNATGAALGGLAETDSGYITVLNSDNLGSESMEHSSVRNVYLTHTAKADFPEAEHSTRQLTFYAENGSFSAGTPVLVPVSLKGGFVLWDVLEKDSAGVYASAGTVAYVTYGADGAVSEIRTFPGALSDCQPLVTGGSILWYVTDSSAPVFYSLEIPEELRYRPSTAVLAGRSDGVNLYSVVSCAEDAEALACCAFYDDFKKMCGVQMAKLRSGTDNSLTFETPDASAVDAKVFLLGRQGVPLCPAETVRIAPYSMHYITGTVTDGSSGAALPGAAVTLSGPDGAPVETVTSGQDGSFSFTVTGYGAFRLRVSHPDYEPRELSGLSVTEDSPKTACRETAALTPKAPAVSGTVRADATGEALSDVRVSVLPAGGGVEIASGQTDSAGAFSVRLLEPGVYDLKFTKAGFTDRVLAGVSVDSWDSSAGTVDLSATLDDDPFAVGDGSAEKPYEIWHGRQLAALAEQSRRGETFAGLCFRQTADIDLSEFACWTPIGANNDNRFQGRYDGNGYTISNLTIAYNYTTSTLDAGLFGYIHNAIIENVALNNLNITSTSTNVEAVGGITGEVWASTIRNCTVSGTITVHPMAQDLFDTSVNNLHCGGIAGVVNGNSSIIGCTNAAAIDCPRCGNIGGIVGRAVATLKSTIRVTGCANTGSVTGEGSAVGPIVGYSYAYDGSEVIIE